MDDTLEFLTKIYSELTEFRKETDTKFEKIEDNFKKLGNQVTSLEHDLKKDISALYNGYMQTYEKLEVIEDKVDKHDIKIQVIEGGRK